MIILLAVLFIGITTLIILSQSSRVIYLKALIIPAACFAFILCLILMSDNMVKAALSGLKLWAFIVVPSLFPFFIAAEIINSTGFIKASGVVLEPIMRPFFNVPGSGSFALAMGVTSGYPVGAKITCDLRNNGLLTKTEAERLLTFTNNSGPLFIIGAVGTGMFGSPQLGILLFICHFLSCITVGFIFRFYGLRSKKDAHVHKSNKTKLKQFKEKKIFTEAKRKLTDEYVNRHSSFGAILGDSIKDSITTIIQIGGFVVLFSVIIQIFHQTGFINILSEGASFILSPIGVDKRILEGIFSGVFEITTGSRFISSASAIPLLIKLPAVSFIIGWAGLSVHFQVMSIASKTDINIRPYLIGKLLQGTFSAIYTWLFLKLFEGKLFYAGNVLGTHIPDIEQFPDTLIASSLILCLTLLSFTFIASERQARQRTKRLFKDSTH